MKTLRPGNYSEFTDIAQNTENPRQFMMCTERGDEIFITFQHMPRDSGIIEPGTTECEVE